MSKRTDHLNSEFKAIEHSLEILQHSTHAAQLNLVSLKHAVKFDADTIDTKFEHLKLHVKDFKTQILAFEKLIEMLESELILFNGGKL